MEQHDHRSQTIWHLEKEREILGYETSIFTCMATKQQKVLHILFGRKFIRVVKTYYSK